jgi:hypothetical protein
MNLKANKSFFDVATGRHFEGDVFEEPRIKVALHMLRTGLCSEVFYETKVIPMEVPAVAALPFRDVHLPDDAEPIEVSASCDQVLSSSDVPQPGATDLGRRRRGRPRKHPA